MKYSAEAKFSSIPSHWEVKRLDEIIFKKYPAACCGDSQETVLRKAAYSAFND